MAYLDSGKYEEVDTSLYMDICTNILTEEKKFDEFDDESDLDDQLTLHCQADKELGNAGERYIYSKLVDKYGQEKVHDATLDGVGCDFKVRDTILKRYEVKSTRQKEGEQFNFHITIKEIKKAEEHKLNFYLCVVYFIGDIPTNTYVIPNPLSVIDIEDYARYVLDYAKRGVCIPQEIQINVDFEKIQKYQNKSL